MTDRDGLLVQAAALSYLADQVAKAQLKVRVQLTQMLRPGDHLGAYLSDGTHVGGVTISKSYWKASVTDPGEFVRWVKEGHPDELVQTVRESFQAAVLLECKQNRAPVTRHGEHVPGVRVDEGNGAYRPTYETETLPALLDAVRANRELLLELES